MNMQIVDFTREWIPQARELIRENALEARAAVPVLPENAGIPPLDGLADNGLGAAAVEDGRLLGFLGAYGPWEPVFCTRDVRGVFSPLHAHAVQKEDGARIWRRLYQAAAQKWARAGAASHAVTLYAHDCEAQRALYLYGFGVRCMDLMRPMELIGAQREASCRELPRARRGEVTALRRELAAHLAKSPCFMLHDPEPLEAWIRKRDASDTRLFAAERDGRIVAYMEAEEDGENFLSGAPGGMNICGAYCLPQYRGTGLAQALLEEMIAAFRAEGIERLGVDCESFNPTAYGFWSKHFAVYTHSVVRRIDENAVR